MPTPNEMNRATFTVPIADVKFDASGDPEAKGSWTMRGHAAVFNRLSHDMGGFRVKIRPGYFTKVLDGNPDVHLLWDHDTRYVLARTRNNSLELREDPMGLHVWSRWAKTQTADELATLMQGGFIDQMSFATDVGKSEWTEDDAGDLTWHLIEADPDTGLSDVTVTAQGAFPQTDASLVASLKDAGALLASAREAGRIMKDARPALVAAVTGEIGGRIALQHVEGAAAVALSAGGRDLAALKERAQARYEAATSPEKEQS